MAVTLSDLIRGGKRLEFGCYACQLHMYVDPSAIALPTETPVPAVAGELRCPQCKAVNTEFGYPIWTRPDARPPNIGAG